MDFDIIIATRNRPSVLQISIPLMLTQDRNPKHLIIVDSSDNHDNVKGIVEQTVRKSNVNVNLDIFHSKAGASFQRNVGLKYVKSPVVMFPDDDSLWFPGVASGIMRIYEKDTDGLIGSVCASESLNPPTGVLGEGKLPYKMGLRDRLQLVRCKLNIVNRIEGRFLPDPFYFEGLEKLKNRVLPNWFGEDNVHLSPSIIGFRMSFRTELIKRINFDELLGRYSLFEDRDVALGVLNNHLIVEAKDAKVFHYRSPETRVNGDEWGVMSILNMAYVICKNTPPQSATRNILIRYSIYRGFRYLFQMTNRYGMRRAIGTWKAIMKLPGMLNCPKEEIVDHYTNAMVECLRKN